MAIYDEKEMDLLGGILPGVSAALRTPLGTMHQMGQKMAAYLPEAELMLYSSSVTGYAAVQQGELDAYAYDRIMMEFAIAGGVEGVRLLEGSKKH